MRVYELSIGLCQTINLNKIMSKTNKNERHIWEGWRVCDFIEDLDPIFNQIMTGGSWVRPFKTDSELKQWCMDNQPYYKKHIPEVFKHFKNKLK